MMIAEICCGSYYDAAQAAKGGAERIELNSALALGGLTPSTATLRMVKEYAPELKVIAMVRPRGAGFCYTEADFAVMEAECVELLQCGADGIAFGCLTRDALPDIDRCKRMNSRIKQWGKEAVFHRAFDCVANPYEAMECLIELGIDRVLTSGLQPTAPAGIEMLAQLQSRYGSDIQIMAGSGVNAQNVEDVIARTGIKQVHSSCKDWLPDPTTVRGNVSYAIAADEHQQMYDVVSEQKVREFIKKTANCANI